MRTPRLILSVLFSLCLSAPGGAGAALVDRVVAVVNEDIILESELDQVALPTFREPVDPDSAEGKRKLQQHRKRMLDQMVEKQLVQQQGKELKIHVSADEVTKAIEEVKKNNGLDDATFTEALKQQGFSMESYRKQLRQELMALKVINQTVRSRVTVADDEVRAQYAQTARQASGDEQQVHLKQVLVPVPRGAGAQVLEERRRVAVKVVEDARGGQAMDELARGKGLEGGDLGWLARGDLPQELREVVVAMDNGDVRGPIQTERGFHVLQLVDKKEGAVKPFEEVKEQLRRQIYDQQVEKGIQSWTKELRRRAHVEIRL